MQVHELTPDKLKMREVVNIDIANDPVLAADYKAEEDPTTWVNQYITYVSQLINRYIYIYIYIYFFDSQLPVKENWTWSTDWHRLAKQRESCDDLLQIG